MEMYSEIDTLCFSSGGIQGLAFVGGLKYLCDNNYINLDKITTYVGTSIGSVVCFLLILGYTPDELIAFFLNYDFKKLELEIDLLIIEEKFGLDEGKGLIELLSFFCEKKLKLNDMSLYDLYILTKKKLILNTTNFNTGQGTLLSYELTPNLSVLTAIRMSSSIPLVYTPVYYNNQYYVDGALTNSILLKECNPNTTLGFFIEGKKYNELKSIQDIIIGSILILSNKSNNIDSKYKVINFSTIDSTYIATNITCKYVQQLLNIGIECAEHYYVNELRKKITKIKINIEDKTNNIVNDLINNIIVKIINGINSPTPSSNKILTYQESNKPPTYQESNKIPTDQESNKIPTDQESNKITDQESNKTIYNT